jgi:hypothetical protein
LCCVENLNCHWGLWRPFTGHNDVIMPRGDWITTCYAQHGGFAKNCSEDTHNCTPELRLTRRTAWHLPAELATPCTIQ